MIVRALALLLAVALIAIGAQAVQLRTAAADLKVEQSKRKQAETDRDVAVAANGSLNEVINTQVAEMVLRDELAADYAARQRALSAALQYSRESLERSARRDPSLRSYLDSPVPRGVVEWLWLPHADGGEGSAAGGAGAADVPAGADAPRRPTHGDGWTWAWEESRALDDCNADKAALRDWLAEATARVTGAAD